MQHGCLLGEWKCQVTSSSYDSDDALSSIPARLVVRIPPADPQIYRNGRLMNTEVKFYLYAMPFIYVKCQTDHEILKNINIICGLRFPYKFVQEKK